MRKSARTVRLVCTALAAAWLPAAVFATQARLEVTASNPYLLAGATQTTYVKVSLTGFNPTKGYRRTPVNVAIVIDRSGSMQGEKIATARKAALMAVDRLNKDDIVSMIAYNDTVSVLVPATKASNVEQIRNGIERLTAGGATALFAGVSKGAQEVRKFLDRNRVNRVILVSDGLANVGPDSSGALGDLGASLIKEGISVTTIGLGLSYNEDLMTRLAKNSDGSSYFAETTVDLVRLFDSEFGDVLSVVAQKVLVTITCEQGVRPVRVLGREAEIHGSQVITTLNQLYSGQEKYVLLEVEVPPGATDSSRELVSVSVSYSDMTSQRKERLSGSLAVSFTDSGEIIAGNYDRGAMIAVVTQEATINNKLALQLRDDGRTEEARQVLIRNAEYLGTNSATLQSDELELYGMANSSDAENIDDGNWARQRKIMRGWQIFNEQQQAAR